MKHFNAQCIDCSKFIDIDCVNNKLYNKIASTWRVLRKHYHKTSLLFLNCKQTRRLMHLQNSNSSSAMWGDKKWRHSNSSSAMWGDKRWGHSNSSSAMWGDKKWIYSNSSRALWGDQRWRYRVFSVPCQNVCGRKNNNV